MAIQFQNLPQLAQPNDKPFMLRESADGPDKPMTLADWLSVMLDSVPRGNLKMLDALRTRKVQALCNAAAEGAVIELDDDVHAWLLKLLFDDARGEELSAGQIKGALAVNLFTTNIAAPLYEALTAMQPTPAPGMKE